MPRPVRYLSLTPCSKTVKMEIDRFLRKLERDNEHQLSIARETMKISTATFVKNQVAYYEAVRGFIRGAISQNSKRQIKR